MPFPVRCFGCSKPICDLYLAYRNRVAELKLSKNQDPNKIIYLTKDSTEKTIEGKVLDELKINHLCCRTTFLTYVDVLV